MSRGVVGRVGRWAVGDGLVGGCRNVGLNGPAGGSPVAAGSEVVRVMAQTAAAERARPESGRVPGAWVSVAAVVAALAALVVGLIVGRAVEPAGLPGLPDAGTGT